MYLEKAKQLLSEGEESLEGINILKEMELDISAPSEAEINLDARKILATFKDFFKSVADFYKGKLAGICKEGKSNIIVILIDNFILKYDLNTQLIKSKLPIIK